MWSSVPKKLKRFAAYSALFLVLFSMIGCALFDYRPEEPKPQPEQPKPEVTEVIPSEPLKTEEAPLIDKTGKIRRGKPYRVKGATYYPLLTAHGYEERGIASWYGPSFHGRKTSCGEIFDMHKISAAHKLLPMHTKIQVTNIENGESITLKVNDRGPFVSGRVLDLSYAAAKDLGMVEKGLARVLIRTSGQVQGQKNEDMSGEFFIHIGSFKTESDAMYLLQDMKSLRYIPSKIKVIRADRDGEIRWRVELGPYNTMSSANKAHSITIRDYPSAFVVANDPEIAVAN